MGVIRSVPSQDFLQKTLGAALNTGVTASATFNNVTGLQNLPGVFIVDRVDTNNVETPSKREVIGYTATSGSTVTTLTRGLAGTTDQDHAIGAIVEFSPDVVWAQSIYDALSTVTNVSTGVPKTTVGSDATGDLYYRSSTGDLARLAVGTVPSILAANASLPYWAFVSGASGSVLTSTGNSSPPVMAPASASGTGGLNAVFQIPGALASLSGNYPGVGGAVTVPTTFTLQHMSGYLSVPSSLASVSVILLNKNAQVGLLAFPAGATFASAASFTNTALAPIDFMTIGINSTASLAQDLSVTVRAT